MASFGSRQNRPKMLDQSPPVAGQPCKGEIDHRSAGGWCGERERERESMFGGQYAGGGSGQSDSRVATDARQQEQQQGQQPVHDINFEDIKRDIQRLSDDELVKLLTDKEAYAHYVANMKELNNMGSSIKELVTKNQTLAESSLEKQNQIADVKNQIAIIRSTEVLEVKNKYEELAKEHNSILSSINVNTLKEKVAEAATEADEASESLSQKLMDKSVSIEAFLDGFLKSREIYHKRTMVLQSLDH